MDLHLHTFITFSRLKFYCITICFIFLYYQKMSKAATRDRNFLQQHIVAIKKNDDQWTYRKEKIEKYLNKLSAQKARVFCTNIRAFMKALKITGTMEVYDSEMESAYSGTIGPKDINFGIDWAGQKKLFIVTD